MYKLIDLNQEEEALKDQGRFQTTPLTLFCLEFSYMILKISVLTPHFVPIRKTNQVTLFMEVYYFLFASLMCSMFHLATP
jgi:uncharacterized membrane protein